MRRAQSYVAPAPPAARLSVFSSKSRPNTRGPATRDGGQRLQILRGGTSGTSSQAVYRDRVAQAQDAHSALATGRRLQMPAERASPPTSDFADCVPADSHMDSESPGAAAVDTDPPLLELREPPASARPGRSSSPRRQTHAEKARETKLRNDPYAVVHNARLVQCNRCLTFIKLSLKSNWDPAHWQKHRERCIRRSGAHVNELREANKKNLPSPDSTESKTRGPSTSRTSSPLTPPPLTPDLDNLGDDHSSIGASAAVDEPPLSSSEFDAEPSSPTPSSPARSPSPPPHATIVLRKPDPSFDEYLVRSRRRAMHELSPQVLDSWQDWSWAQLKEPVWVTEGRPGVTREDAVVATYLLALKGERTGHRAPVSVASSVSTNYDSD